MPASHTVRVDLAERSYDILVGKNLLAQSGPLATDLLNRKKCAVVTDSNVAPLYAQIVLDSLTSVGITPTLITVPAGEPSKSMAVVEDINRQMLRAGLDRKAFLIALGGGVIGDLAGFVASIFLRGIPFIQIPTTVLSQVDSSVGGKTGVNTPEGKNLIGTFSQPALVLADTATLATLPPREYREGFAEIIKHAAIRDAAMFDLITKTATDSTLLPDLIARNVAIKARIVEADEHELNGTRALLNFGHTLGHAIEATAGYGQLFHGEAISLGMIAATHLSVQHSGLPLSDAEEIFALLKLYQLPTQLPSSLLTDPILKHMQHDKKFSEGQIRFVLLRDLGEAFLTKDLTLAHLTSALEHLRS
ncbi:3-dehydroquinate synthase [Phragmitibacter flavus]|uniref:3-dehydroquinate synthase n=1 Tax=Phragmitibacter flavus TaxID=2576071 RepID=A0A5R8KFS3_9BACT|nr:3-dehydroquinate synthase [Phragmitibacter flavus]TLD71143.1 3-dehydroquinate synthase [Phragmitibacter flavus]